MLVVVGRAACFAPYVLRPITATVPLARLAILSVPNRLD